MLYSSFEDMPVWQKGMELAERVFALTETLPKKLRLDLANPAVSAIRSGQYCRRLWPKTHQGQAQLLLHVTGFIGRNKKSSDLRVQGRLFSRIGTERVARTCCKYLGRIEQVNQLVYAGID
jgi:hypothetical protein